GVYLPQQWHLQLAQVTAAWEIPGLTYPQGRPDITVAILDDGIDLNHPEFTTNLADGTVKVKHRFDFSSNTPNGMPITAQDNHGTACSGLAVASGFKAYGTAPGCGLIAVRSPDYLGVADEARMFQWVADQGADTISCSWGGPDGV